jgi:protein-disulfide isomerase
MRRKAKTTRKLTSLQKTILSAAGIVLLAFVMYVVHDASKPSLKEQTLIKQRYDIPVDGFPSTGPADAPVVIVEFSDFQCEYCALFSKETFPMLMDKYAGKIRFVFRSSPSGSDLSTSFQSAQAALCANDQNAYLEYHDALFENQDRLGIQLYRETATNLGLDLVAFDRCLEDGKYRDWIQADQDFALKTGVQGTPTFFINGLALVGARPIEVFTEVIDAELEKTIYNGIQ